MRHFVQALLLITDRGDASAAEVAAKAGDLFRREPSGSGQDLLVD